MKTIGWVFVLGAVMLMLSAALNYLVYQGTSFPTEDADALWGMSWRFAALVLFFRSFWLFFAAHVTVAALAAIAGVGFVRGQGWARIALMGLASLPTVVLAVVAGVWFTTALTTSHGDVRWVLGAVLPAVRDGGEMLVDTLLGIVSVALRVTWIAVRFAGIPASDDVVYQWVVAIKGLFMLTVALSGLLIVRTLNDATIDDAMGRQTPK